jgi:formylglycine-generating enzyme required for sulfatase activity
VKLAQFKKLFGAIALFLFTISTALAQQGNGGPTPPGMVWIPGGEFSMGAAANGQGNGEMPMASNDAEPVHRVFVNGFWMDTTAVTNDVAPHGPGSLRILRL